MHGHGEVLVAIINDKRDFAIVSNQHWYRIPVTSAKKWLKDHWPPRWLAFYQTKVFGAEAYSVSYYARVVQIREAYRWQLLPDEMHGEKRNRRYYQLLLDPLQRLPKPILSRRLRRIVFIPTTWEKFINANEINDLYDESPLEDRLWTEFKRCEIPAERQEFVTIKKENYALDFAIYCAKGKIDVETDGDSWHANPEKAVQDNLRDNALETVGWRVLRFTTQQIREDVETYCLRTVVETINNSGGVVEGETAARRVGLRADWTH